MRIVVKSLFLVLAFLLFACNEKIVENIKYVEKEVAVGKIIISEKEVEIGQKVIAHFKNVKLEKIYNVTLFENAAAYSIINDSTVSLLVPDKRDLRGHYVFYCATKETYDTVLVSNGILLPQEILGLGYKPLTKWNTHENITKEDTKRLESWGTEFVYWSAQTVGDTIKFLRQYTCHDECSVKELMYFKDNGKNKLPEFLYAAYIKDEWMYPLIKDEMTTFCKIIIDKWDGETFSGTFVSKKHNWFFWYKKNN